MIKLTDGIDFLSVPSAEREHKNSFVGRNAIV
jgi:hypothetical protein